MSSTERLRQMQLIEAPQTDYEGLAEQPTTSLRMEQAVTNLAAAYGVDLAHAGASFAVNMPHCPQHWLITNIDGERIGITRGQVNQEGFLCPDLDMVFAITPDGWEPQELAHSDQVWQDYAQAMQAAGQPLADQQGDFNFVTFTDYMARDIVQTWAAQGKREDARA